MTKTNLDLKSAKQVLIPIEEVGKREEKVAAEAEEKLTSLKREAETKSVLNRHEVVTLKIQLEKKESELVRVLI